MKGSRPRKTDRSSRPQPARKTPASRGAGPGRHQRKAEEKFHGLHACEALFQRRPQDIVRVYLTQARRQRLMPLIDFCVRERKGFQIVADDNLQRLTGSLHHEGVVVLAKAVRRWDLAELLREIDAGRLTGPLLYLDGVQNPHNLGSILRTAAHFGVGAILGAQHDLPPLSAAAVRVAEGGAEHVAVCDLADPTGDLRRLKKSGFQIAAASSHGGDAIQSVKLPAKEKAVLVLGSEGKGISRPIEALADLRMRIPGTGAVESLNVSVACGIVLAEACRFSQETG
jgi:TrmH RNA methyltransferase